MRTHLACATTALLSFACAAPSSAQVAAPRPAGRVSFYVNSAKLTGDGINTSASEVVTSVIYGLNERPTSGLEYGVDFRHARRSEPGRPARLSLYDAYVGARFGEEQRGDRTGDVVAQVDDADTFENLAPHRSPSQWWWATKF